MICPFCRSDNTLCKDSRPSGLGRRRRYACGNCGKRFSTMELAIWPPVKEKARKA